MLWIGCTSSECSCEDENYVKIPDSCTVNEDGKAIPIISDCPHIYQFNCPSGLGLLVLFWVVIKNIKRIFESFSRSHIYPIILPEDLMFEYFVKNGNSNQIVATFRKYKKLDFDEEEAPLHSEAPQ
jgi:hypothetical protein